MILHSDSGKDCSKLPLYTPPSSRVGSMVNIRDTAHKLLGLVPPRRQRRERGRDRHDPVGPAGPEPHSGLPQVQMEGHLLGR